MLYTRSLEIERRLDHILRLVRTGKYSTPKLADEVGVSIPTISRCVSALRERGHNIRAEKHGNGWRYVLALDPKGTGRAESGPLAQTKR
jgi:biotin operon repressor